MSNNILEVSNLSVAAEDKQILRELSISVQPGTTHILMGPNGAGKSTLGHAIMGNPEYEVTGGSIVFNGQDITDATPDKRAQVGLFLSFQAPVEVPGVPLFTFLRAIVAQRPDLKLRGPKLKKRIAEIMELLSMDAAYLDRELNVGFSGGEKKKIEMLQLLLLQPKLAILDETDSGLDVDALDTVSRAIRAYQEMGGTLLIITHNTRILEHVDVDTVHVLVRGTVVDESDSSLIAKIDAEGFEKYVGAEGTGAAYVAAAKEEYPYPPMTPAAARLEEGRAEAMAAEEDRKAQAVEQGDVVARMEAALADYDAVGATKE